MLPANSMAAAAAAEALVTQSAKNQLPDKAARDIRVGQQRFMETTSDQSTVLPLSGISHNLPIGVFRRSNFGRRAAPIKPKQKEISEKQQFLFEMKPTPIQEMIYKLDQDSTPYRHIDIRA